MNWLGKVLGGAFGFLMGGPLGAVFGTAVGHRFDQGLDETSLWHSPWTQGVPARVHSVFLTSTFAVMGHLAKVDGRVCEAEIVRARAIMMRLALSEEMRRVAIHFFTEGKRGDFPLDEVLMRLRRECWRCSALIRQFVEIQIETALADGALCEAEEHLLLRICDRVGFSRFEFHTLRTSLEKQHLRSTGNRQQHDGKRAFHEPALSDAYATLRVSPTASDAELKRAYRRLMSRYHPDKLAASGESDAMLRRANEKTQQIRRAFETIRRARQARSI